MDYIWCGTAGDGRVPLGRFLCPQLPGRIIRRVSPRHRIRDGLRKRLRFAKSSLADPGGFRQPDPLDQPYPAGRSSDPLTPMRLSVNHLMNRLEKLYPGTRAEGGQPDNGKSSGAMRIR